MPLQAATALDVLALPPGPPPGVPPFLPHGGLLAPPAGGVLMPPMLPPPRFPGFFDTSQPPPGMRMPFPPPNVVPNVEGQGDVEMEIEDSPEQVQKRGSRGGSRWGNNENEVETRLRNLASNEERPLLGDLPPWEQNQDRGKIFFCSIKTKIRSYRSAKKFLLTFDEVFKICFKILWKLSKFEIILKFYENRSNGKKSV